MYSENTGLAIETMGIDWVVELEITYVSRRANRNLVDKLKTRLSYTFLPLKNYGSSSWISQYTNFFTYFKGHRSSDEIELKLLQH